MEACKKNLPIDKIVSEFGKDDMKICNTCSNLEYCDGMMSCKLVTKETENNNSK